MHHIQHTSSPRSSWLGSVLGLSALSLLLGGISCSSEPGGESSTVIPPGTVVDSCPPGYTCDTNDNGDVVVIGGGGTGGATGATGGATGVGGTTGATGGTTGATGGATNTGGTTSEETCTDELLPDNPEPCQNWKDWGHCEETWLQGYCNATCGRCTPSGTGGGNGSGGNGNGTGGTLGNDNPYPPITNPEGTTHATRYWDCCKPSCGWSNQGNIQSCDLNNSNVGVNDNVKSVCDGGQGQTCHGMAPWAHSTEVSYGFAAANGRTCGACYQMQFTGQGEHNASDPGSQAIAGKTMIVKVTNRGAELGDGHFDLLIPGGGLGMFNGCTHALGISEAALGGHEGSTWRYGGFLAKCGGNLECVRNECNTVFSDHSDLRAGCLWFVDWFKGADNPRFTYKEVECPPELSGFN